MTNTNFTAILFVDFGGEPPFKTYIFMMVKFTELFDVSQNGITPKYPVQLGGVTMGPGVTFGAGVLFGGVDLSQHTDKHIEVEVDQTQGVNIITKIYNF